MTTPFTDLLDEETNVTVAAADPAMMSSSSAFETRSFRLIPTYATCKAVIDCVLAMAILVLVSPLILFLAALISASDGGSPFYSQIRLGRHGRRYRIYKL